LSTAKKRYNVMDASILDASPSQLSHDEDPDLEREIPGENEMTMKTK